MFLLFIHTPPTQIVIKRTDDTPPLVAGGKTLKREAPSANIRCLLLRRGSAAVMSVIDFDEHRVVAGLGGKKNVTFRMKKHGEKN